MKAIRRISIMLCFVFLVNLFSPIALASESNVFPEMYIATIADYANCFYQSDTYTANALIDMNTGDGCFAISYSNSNEYIYEYYFSVTLSEVHANASAFWNSLLSRCMSNQEQWRELYKPTIISSTSVRNTRSSQSSDITSNFAPALENQLNITEYIGRIIHTDSRNRYLFHIHEDIEFNAVENNKYFIAETMSFATLIVGILLKPLTAALLSLFVDALGSTIAAGTEVGTHTVCAIIQRYVKRMDSSIWLNSTCRVISYEGYAISNLNFYEIDPDTESTLYTHSESYFYDKDAQIDDGYYYLTHNYS